MDDQLKQVAGLGQAPKIDFKGREHALVIEQHLAVEAHGAGVVDTPADKEKAPGQVRQALGKARPVVPVRFSIHP